MRSAIFLSLCICNIWGRTIPECQKDCKILLPKVEQVFGCTHSASFIFSSPKGPREGQWLCRWCGRIWQLGSLHSPGPSSQVQRKGSARQQGPMALLALIQADTWGHASRARQALRHELSCLFLPGSSATERGSSGVPALSQWWPGTSCFQAFSFSAWESHPLSSRVLYSLSLRSHFYSSCSFPLELVTAICFQLLKVILFSWGEANSTPLSQERTMHWMLVGVPHAQDPYSSFFPMQCWGAILWPALPQSCRGFPSLLLLSLFSKCGCSQGFPFMTALSPPEDLTPSDIGYECSLQQASNPHPTFSHPMWLFRQAEYMRHAGSMLHQLYGGWPFTILARSMERFCNDCELHMYCEFSAALFWRCVYRFVCRVALLFVYFSFELCFLSWWMDSLKALNLQAGDESSNSSAWRQRGFWAVW